MDTDGYTPTIALDQLVNLAREYGPVSLAGERSPSDPSTGNDRPDLGRTLCPCVQGNACICEAVADEFERLAQVFRQQQAEVKPRAV